MIKNSSTKQGFTISGCSGRVWPDIQGGSTQIESGWIVRAGALPVTVAVNRVVDAGVAFGRQAARERVVAIRSLLAHYGQGTRESRVAVSGLSVGGRWQRWVIAI